MLPHTSAELEAPSDGVQTRARRELGTVTEHLQRYCTGDPIVPEERLLGYLAPPARRIFGAASGLQKIAYLKNGQAGKGGG